jgi:CBS domain containing-hemolysin-like protein
MTTGGFAEGVFFMGITPVEASWVWIILGLLSIPLLIAVNAFFVAAEFALVLVRKTRVEEMIQQGRIGAKTVEDAVRHIDRTIAAVQVGITAAGIALGWVGEPALARLVDPALDFLPATWQGVVTHTLALGITFLFLIFISIVFGELIPKDIALRKPSGTALWVARPMLLFSKLSRPFVALMLVTKNIILRSFGIQPATTGETAHSIEELSLLVEDSQDSGVLSRTQAELVQKTFRLSGKKVKDCLVPREKMVALELKTSPEQVLEVVRKTAHTRMPVYDGDIDKIVGIVNTKNLFYLFSLKGLVVVQDAMYEALFLKPDEDVATALQLFRKARRPMAVVRDDHGHVLGILTLEDVLEEIVGEIEDEHDVPVAKGTASKNG